MQSTEQSVGIIVGAFAPISLYLYNKKDARLICVVKHRLLASYKINKYKLNPDS